MCWDETSGGNTFLKTKDVATALAAAGSDIYMLFSNELRPVGENNHLDANRAYVKLTDLNPVAEAPQGAPGRRVRTMPMQPQVATGFEAAEANEAPRKVLINGEFFIALAIIVLGAAIIILTENMAKTLEKNTDKNAKP